MNRNLERLQQKHRRLDRMIDMCRNSAAQDGIYALKRLRLRIKDRITQLQRGTGPITP